MKHQICGEKVVPTREKRMGIDIEKNLGKVRMISQQFSRANELSAWHVRD